MNKLFSVIIPAADPDMLGMLFASMASQRDYVREVIVVEDWVYEQDYRIRDVCAINDAIYLRLPTPQRTPFDWRAHECRSMGQERATGDVVVFLDQDVLLCPWYFQRLAEIHLRYGKIVFSAERLLLGEDKFEAKTRLFGLVNAFSKRLDERGKVKFYPSFWHKIKGFPVIRTAESNNMSVRREHLSKIGKWESLFGYGDEDIFFAYRAFRAGLKIGYIDWGKDLYVCHVRHPARYVDAGSGLINRLYLFEKHPDFKACVMDQYQREWSYGFDFHGADIVTLYQKGIQGLPAFRHLPFVPEELKKYIKQNGGNGDQPAR